MADKNSTVRFNPPQLKHAPNAVRFSPKVRKPEQLSIIAARPSPSSVSSPVTYASDSKSRSAVTAPPEAPRTQDVHTSRSAQKSVGSSVVGKSKTVKTGRQDLIENLKSPDWIISNPRGEYISSELKDAVSSLISICRMLERIDERLNRPPFKSERERQHVESLSKRLLKSWAAFSMALEGYYDDDGWARSIISRTAFDMMEIVSDLQALLEYAGKVLPLQGKCKEYDPDDNLPQYWLTKDAISRYEGVEKELTAAMYAAQQLNEKFSRLPMKRKAGAGLAERGSGRPDAGSPRNLVYRAGKPLFQQKNASELESLNKQASAIYMCLGDLGKQLQLTESHSQPVVAFLDDSAIALKETMQRAKTIKQWEAGMHRSRHHFLKAHTKLQDIAPIIPTLYPGELAIAQKVATGIYASFDSVINIMLHLGSDGVTELQVNQKRQEIPSSPVKTISMSTTVTRSYISDKLDSPSKKPNLPRQVGKTLLQRESGNPTPTVVNGAVPSIRITGPLPDSEVANADRSPSPRSLSSRKARNAGARAQNLTVAWQDSEDAAKAGKRPSD